VNGFWGAAVPFLSPDQVLAFTRPTPLALTRADNLSGSVSFGLESLSNAHVDTLLAHASGRSANALSYNSIVEGNWLASEGQARGSAGAVPGTVGAGLWLRRPRSMAPASRWKSYKPTATARWQASPADIKSP